MQYKNEAHSKLQGCPSLLAVKKTSLCLICRYARVSNFSNKGKMATEKNACLASIIQYLNLIILCKLIILTFPCWDFLAKACD